MEGISKGGGRGKYATADGDAPVAMHPNKGRDDINRVGDDAVVDEAVVDELWEAAVEDNADRVVDDVVVDDVGEAVVDNDLNWNAQVPTCAQVAKDFHEKAVIDNMITAGGLGDYVLTLTGGGGGGRGIYADADGDVPTTRIWRPPAMMPTRNGKTGKRINVILKNARSLASDEKLENLLLELEATEWDIVVVNETWRLQKE